MPIVKHVGGHRKRQNQRYDEKRGSARDRGYSREWDKFSKAWLSGHPLCEYCFNQGRVSAAELTDHIVPHGGDPNRFWPEFESDQHLHFAACCRECHDGPKQRAEVQARNTGRDVREILHRWGMLPDGFPGVDPEAPIRAAGAWLICGPPGAGKSTKARAIADSAIAAQFDVYDLDDIAEELGFPRYGRTHHEAIRAIQERDIRLLSHKASRGAIVVASCPTVQERRAWAKRLNCEPIIMMEPRDVLIQRIRKRSRSVHEYEQQVNGLDHWFARSDL